MDNTNNSETFWHYVKEMSKKTCNAFCLADQNSILQPRDQDEANIQNNYFITVFVDEPNDGFLMAILIKMHFSNQRIVLLVIQIKVILLLN